LDFFKKAQKRKGKNVRDERKNIETYLQGRMKRMEKAKRNKKRRKTEKEKLT
jgi:hypothetical protein